MDVNADPKLPAKIRLLPADQLHMLYLMAAAYEGVEVGHIIQMRRWLPPAIQDKLPDSLRGIDTCISALSQKGLIKRGTRQQYRIIPDLSWRVLREVLVTAENVAPYAEAVRRYQPARSVMGASWPLHVRELQLLLMARDGDAFWQRVQMSVYIARDNEAKLFDPIRYFFDRPFDPAFLGTFSASFQVHVCEALIQQKLAQLDPMVHYLDFLEGQLNKAADQRQRERILEFLLMIRAYQGDVDELGRLLNDPIRSPEAGYATLYEAVLYVFQGAHAEALETFQLASRRLKARGYFSDYFVGFMHALLLLWEKDFAKVETYARRKSPYAYLYEWIDAVALFQQNREHQARQIIAGQNPQHALSVLLIGLAHVWMEQPLPQALGAHMTGLLEQAIEHGYPLFAREYAAILARQPEPPQAALLDKARSAGRPAGNHTWMERLERSESWQRALEALLRFEGRATQVQEANSRVIWLVNLENHMHIQPVEQKLRKQGGWTQGRNIALKRLYKGEVDNLSPQDQRIRAALKSYSHGYYGAEEYEWEISKALMAMVGHPLIFLYTNPEVPVELVEVSPELIVEDQGNHFQLSLHPPVTMPGFRLIRETNTRYQVMDVSPGQWELLQVFAQGPIRVPSKAKAQLAKAVANVAPVLPVQSELLDNTVDLPEVEASARPHILLLPMGDGFKVELLAKPFETAPPYLKPGEGRELLIAEVEGIRTRTRRDLTAERSQAAAVEAACPTLQAHPAYRQEWQLETAEDALNLLTELLPLREQGEVVVEWPKGEKLRLAGAADVAQVALKVKAKQDWLALEGEVKVSEGQVLSLQALLQRLSENPDSRFVTLEDGQYLALTQKLRQHLLALQNLLQSRTGELRLHQLAGGMLEEFAEGGAHLKVNAAWRRQQARLQEARSLVPVVPPDFQADLRPYQEEGFRWLGRLAHWGVGACLADDMGLGKTVQALALLLDRAKLGPALVVAPASVARNWLREAERFAPSLRPYLLHEGNRAETIAGLGPFDLLITSYTLLQIEQEGLATVSFATVILDEAQAIKNRQTKRSQAAKSLQAGFRLLTTGTPIENHLGELWNLFDFLNPGLLGSLDQFNTRFALPIERNQDVEKRQQLRKLLRPFILRRRKSEVLDELPEKTEITLSVPLSEAERSLYEALRREAVSRLEAGPADASQAGAQHLRILAEITRLRQACCHPQLVLPESEIPSSKLEVFAETVQELRANGHKALVFSQFVKHLRLVEAWVQGQDIPYQYLDGQTPLPERERRVQAFQQGEGDLFLISLKAGGTGLNLTAADYVIHLDPWWNPAVEDQASDRAHRIGQQRPVTVYRLVTEQTIEEKIVQLHAEKRELADSLLEGTDTGGKLDAEALLALLREV